ncbi:hypothetical protein OQA88_1775 [Cercophora sp. LCS_1]
MLFNVILLATTAFAAAVRPRGINDCSDSSFENQTSGGSPKADDCAQLAKNIQGDGTWTYDSGGTQYQLAQYGTCAFGVQSACLPHRCPAGGIYVYIGNQDIIDVITESIKRFKDDKGLVGSKGIMNCTEMGSGYPIGTLWGIYSTGVSMNQTFLNETHLV